MSKSDNNHKPRTNLFELLPEVHRSDINETVLETSFNRHLTKDDLQRVSGFIGERNPLALVDRQIKEPTPHRQAFQLEPAVHTKVGSTDHILTQAGFLHQLEMMGVNIDRIQKWAKTDQFNWVPPINIDMLINYYDYFWPVTDADEPQQYITIENRCNKATSKAKSYENQITKKGALHAILSVDPKTNTFVIQGDLTDVLSTDVGFFTKNSTNVNVNNTFWTVLSSQYDVSSNETTLTPVETIAIVSNEFDPAPTTSIVGRWWYAPDTDTLRIWNGSSWTPTAVFFAGGDVSLSEMLLIYQRDANCVCNEDYGWDMGQWDDGQSPLLTTPWNETFLSNISSSATPSPSAITEGMWYDTQDDRLYQWDGASWVLVVSSFSSYLIQTTGAVRWDSTVGCEAQEFNQWSEQNKWSHKSEVSSFGNVRRAQLPIIEFNSTIEQNEWVRVSYAWKYRAQTDKSFESTALAPSRLELEPVKGYGAVYNTTKNKWELYLFADTATVNRDIDHTSTFVPGFKFRVADDVALNEVYTVTRSEFRKITSADPINTVLAPNPITDYYVTVVELDELLFTAPTVGGGITNVRIEPIQTANGDTWKGYHAHWLLDEDNTTYQPSSHVPLNPLLVQSLTDVPTPSVLPDGIVNVGIAHQEFTTTVSGVTAIPLDASLQYTSVQSNVYALPDSNELRVYLNGVRQYGNYTEQDANGTPNYTMVGNTSTTVASIDYVTGIVFDQPLAQYDVVRIEVGPASFDDMGMFAVPVRTEEDEATFISALVSGTQPVYRSLTEYQRVEQVKTQINQYPLFNVFDVCDGSLVDASRVFAYEESADNPINTDIGKRITTIDNGRDYTFVQYLLEKDNGKLYGYRNADSAPAAGTFWYSPMLGTVKVWDGYAWSSSAPILTAAGIVYRSVVVSETEPTNLINVPGALWMNSISRVLYTWNEISVAWDTITDVIVNDADPTIYTVWRTTNDTPYQYIPDYVDEDRQSIAVGSPNGDWETLDQWFYNPEHKNRKELNYTQLVAHFTSIAANQEQIPGLLSGGIYSLTQNQYDYGVGGTIKDHNNSFDTLISAVNVNNVSPVGVLEWAEDQYALGALLLRDEFNRNVVELFGDYSSESLLDQRAYASNFVINQYSTNDFVSLVYGDTSAYDPSTGVGMPNWIASAPMFGLSEAYRPHKNTDGDFVEIYHHDGHRSTVFYSPGEKDRLAKQIINIVDTRQAGATLGKQSSSVPPATHAAFLTQFGGITPRVGVYWYRVVAGVNTLYRFSPYSVSPIAPSFYVDGAEIPDGVMYYNNASQEVYVKQGLSWVVHASGGDISSLWTVVDFADYVGNILLDVENRLYDAVPQHYELKFDYSSLTATVDDQHDYDVEYEKRFYAFVAERNITAPLVNINYATTDAFTWNYVNSIPVSPPRSDISPDPAGCWQEVYTRWYGTPYPHLEPWKLQGYTDKPTWWDAEYLETNGSRRWKYDHSTTTGMWENIRIGAIPVGRALPSGSGVGTGSAADVAIQYSYFSVNIDDNIVDGYQPDEILPPYFNDTTAPAGVRSIFTTLSQVVAPDSDYVFGDGGPVEWEWTTSSEYVYDKLIIAFLLQPVKFLHKTFGVNFINVGGIDVETIGCRVYSHENAMFHGEIYDVDETFVALGINQWYVNYNRFSGYDTNGEFRSLWAGWTPELSYSFAGITDTSTFEISTKYYDITGEDYDIILANTGVFKDVWSDGFEVKVLTIPPSIIQYNNQAAWRFDLSLLTPLTRNVEYYGVKQYPFNIDTTTNVGKLFNYRIVDASSPAGRFNINGNQAEVFTPGTTFAVSGSTLNDGSYTVVSASYDSSTNRTRLLVAEPVMSSVADGNIDLSGFAHSWQTGQRVVITSSKQLPIPLVEGESYFIISLGGKNFKLAETYNDALAGNAIDFATAPTGELMVGEVASSFYVYGRQSTSKELWYHYAIDTSKVLTATPPLTVVGIQRLINIIDGYAAHQEAQGIKQPGDNTAEFDQLTGRAITWGFEIERFIDWAYNLRASRVRISDKFSFSINGVAPTDELVFNDVPPEWTSGTPVTFAASGSLPAPLIANTPYYIVRTSASNVFKVSIYSDTSITAGHIMLTTAGAGTMYVSRNQAATSFPSFELNPLRNNISIDTPQGMVSNVITGPYADIRTNQTIFDQYGRTLSADKLNVYRNDAITRIAVRQEIPDDVNPVPPELRTQYDYLHLGGGHFFIEGYEHILLFEDYTTDGSLIYDQFLGLSTTSFNLDYYEGENYTLRPTLGGHYLLGNEFFRNIEGSVVDLHNYYDTYDLREGTVQAEYARHLIGYTGEQQYLDLVNMNNKSQFLFYRGMIQHKGSVAGARAYINSRRFIDAKVDEFWAWKMGEFGNVTGLNYPEIKLFSDDSVEQDVQLHFLSPQETVGDADVITAIDDGFKVVEWGDQTRWSNYPEQRAEIQSPIFLETDVTSMTRVYVGLSSPTNDTRAATEFWYDLNDDTLKEWDTQTSAWITSASNNRFARDGSDVFVRLEQQYDAVYIVRRNVASSGVLTEYTSTDVLTPSVNYVEVNASVVRMDIAEFDGLLHFFTLNPGFSKNNASRLVDKKSKSIIADIQLWDPARGIHSTQAINSVDFQTLQDPAQYLATLDQTNIAESVWGENEVGKVWLDVNSIGYKRYYDSVTYPTFNERLNTWGVLSDWASVGVYEWVSSSVAPSEWADLVERQKNSSLPQREKATGTAKQTLFARTRTSYVASISGIESGSHSAVPATFVQDDTQGRCSVNFTLTPIAGSSTGLSVIGDGPYQANIFVDGDGYLVSVTPSSASTYGALITQLNAQLLGSATAAIVGNSIVITSTSTGLGSTVAIQDVNLFGSLNVGPAVVQLPVDGSDGTQYTQTITIDGIDYDISINGDDAQTGAALAIEITNQLGAGVGTATFDGINIKITSSSVGTSSSVVINSGGTIFTTINSDSTVGAYGTVEVAAGTFSVDDLVLFVADTMPQGLESGQKYLISSLTNMGATDLLTLTLDDIPVNIETTGTNLYIVPAFKNTDWIKKPLLVERVYGALEMLTQVGTLSPTVTLTSADWKSFDAVNVYINDELVVVGYELDSSLTVPLTGITIALEDVIEVVRPLRSLTSTEQEFDPDIEDDGITMIQWKYDYEYASFTRYDGLTPKTQYYFWVEGSQRRESNTVLSAYEIAQQLVDIPTPYFVVQLPKWYDGGTPYTSTSFVQTVPTSVVDVPIFYRQAVLRNCAKYLVEDERFVWQFTHNRSLRTINPKTAVRKNRHSEWYMFRREQPAVLPRELWDKLTEAVMMCKRTDFTIRVPSLERELYDATYGTDTRFGLSDGQAFCDSNYALATILNYLQDPANDFVAVNIDSFFAQHSFDTPTNILAAMDTIYNTFGAEHVNNIWFETLMDALSTRAQYDDLMKTSWVALHGIRVLEVAGVFDD